MAKITIKELYYGDKYAVISEVFKTMFLSSPNKAGVDEQTALELEIVRQTLIVVENERRMRKTTRRDDSREESRDLSRKGKNENSINAQRADQSGQPSKNAVQ